MREADLRADHCDKCTQRRESHRLELPGGAGVYLCLPCWSIEMEWRQQRNKKVAHPYKILPYPGGPV
jgi:hypothetical protein